MSVTQAQLDLPRIRLFASEMILKSWRERKLVQRLALAEAPAGERAITDAITYIRFFERQQRSDLEVLLNRPVGPPRCPRCRSRLVVRRARRGRNAGGKFWGCPSWPKCTYAADIDTFDTDRYRAHA